MITPHLDPGVLAALREVMGDDYLMLVDTYLKDSEHRLALLLASTDAVAVREAAHSFKGSSGNMGAEALARLCGQLEHLPLDAPSQAVASLLGQIATEFAAVRTGFLADRESFQP